jgi:hypothetical protein
VIGGEPSIETHNLKRHRSISMVEEPTKTLRGALAFFRGASCSIKSRDPIKQDRMIDFATARRIVNAANKNKRILVEWGCFGRMKSLAAGRARKECFGLLLPLFDSGMKMQLDCWWRGFRLEFSPIRKALRRTMRT